MALSNAELWTALAALGVPFVVALITQEHWTPMVKWVCFAIVALVVGFITTWLAGSLNQHDLTRDALIVLSGATLAFHGFKPAVHQVESATTVAPVA